jgi:hypothetical protein
MRAWLRQILSEHRSAETDAVFADRHIGGSCSDQAANLTLRLSTERTRQFRPPLPGVAAPLKVSSPASSEVIGSQPRTAGVIPNTRAGEYQALSDDFGAARCFRGRLELRADVSYLVGGLVCDFDDRGRSLDREVAECAGVE